MVNEPQRGGPHRRGNRLSKDCHHPPQEKGSPFRRKDSYERAEAVKGHPRLQQVFRGRSGNLSAKTELSRRTPFDGGGKFKKRGRSSHFGGTCLLRKKGSTRKIIGEANYLTSGRVLPTEKGEGGKEGEGLRERQKDKLFWAWVLIGKIEGPTNEKSPRESLRQY